MIKQYIMNHNSLIEKLMKEIPSIEKLDITEVHAIIKKAHDE
jgi:hypothetical protein